MRSMALAQPRSLSLQATWRRGLRLLPVALVLLACAVVAWDLLAPWDVNGHSVYFNQQRLVGLDTALRLGYGYRWLPSFYYGHGSPIFNYIAPLPSFVAEVFLRLGLTPSWAIKAVTLLGILGTGLGFMWLGRIWAGPWAGLGAGLMAICTPYFLVDIYVRANLGEVCALGWAAFPLVAIVSLSRRPSAWMMALLAGSSAAMVLSHNAVALLFFGADLACATVLTLAGPPRQRGATGARLALGLGLGLGLSAFFWLPALLELGQVRGLVELTASGLRVEEHFVTLGQILSGGWGYGVSGPGDNDGMPLQAGQIHLLMLLISLILVVHNRYRRDPLLLTFGALGLVSLLMVTALSAPLWRLLSPLAVLQFPWRFYALFVACSAVTAGFCAQTLMDSVAPRRAALVLLAVISAILFTANDQARAQYVKYIPQSAQSAIFGKEAGEALDGAPELSSLDEFFSAERQWRMGIYGTTGHEYLPATVERRPQRAAPTFAVRSGEARIVEQPQPGGFAARLDVAREATVDVGVFYDRGWRALLDGARLATSPAPGSGLLRLHISPGSHQLSLTRAMTGIQRLAIVISLISLLSLLLACVAQQISSRR